MSDKPDLSVAERITQLLDHLGIDKAHFAARNQPDWAGFTSASPERVSSLAIICPETIDVDAARPFGPRVTVFSGDTGPNSQRITRLIADLQQANLVTIQNYDAVSWTDVMADLTDWIAPQIAMALSASDSQPEDFQVPDQRAGEVAGISYRIQGVGPPLVLLPLALSPSQWAPVLPQLSQRFCTITLSGEHLRTVSVLENRGNSAGYLRVIRSLVDECEIQTGDSVLEVGSGSGVVTRWLARRAATANKIIAVDISPYLIGEAEALARKGGIDDRIEFRQGDAESLPFADATFDVTISSTVMEEVNADSAIAEMVRVSKPGGRVALAVRAMDVPYMISLPMSPDLKKKASVSRANVSENGCADVSLYRRVGAAGLVDLRLFPMLAVPSDFERVRLRLEASLSTDEAEEWHRLVTQGEAAGTFFIAHPYHCAVGTKPL
jgi:SAM-dependent methyltransferase